MPVGAEALAQVVAGHEGLLRYLLQDRVASDEAPELCPSFALRNRGALEYMAEITL